MKKKRLLKLISIFAISLLSLTCISCKQEKSTKTNNIEKTEMNKTQELENNLDDYLGDIEFYFIKSISLYENALSSKFSIIEEKEVMNKILKAVNVINLNFIGEKGIDEAYYKTALFSISVGIMTTDIKGAIGFSITKEGQVLQENDGKVRYTEKGIANYEELLALCRM